MCGCELIMDFDTAGMPTCSLGPPSVVIETPQPGGALPGVLLVRGTATDCLKIAEVRMRLGNAAWVAVKGTGAWYGYLDLSKATAGRQVLRVEATNISGQRGEATRTLEVFRFVPAAAAVPKPSNDLMMATDLDGDGHLDLGFHDGLLWGDGKGGFARSRTGSTVLSCGEVPADFDGDGDLDLACRGKGGTADQGKVMVWTQGPPGVFKLSFSSKTSNPCLYGLSGGDIDSDGDIDLLVTNVIASGACMTINTAYFFINDGKGGFTPVDSNARGVESGTNRMVWPVTVVFADLDGDGDQDLIIGGSLGTPSVLYENLGKGMFKERDDALLPGNDHTPVQAMDFDNDGVLDLAFILRAWARLPFLMRGLGKLQFQDVTVRTSFNGAFLADLNGDGYQEPLGSTRVSDGAGLWYFDSQVMIGDIQVSSLSAMDIDGNGTLDLYSPALEKAQLSTLAPDSSAGKPRFLTLRVRRSSGRNTHGLGARVALYESRQAGDMGPLRGLQVMGFDYQVRFSVTPDRRYDAKVHIPGEQPILCISCQGGAIIIKDLSCSCP